MCQQVAQALGHLLARSSVELVCRAFYPTVEPCRAASVTNWSRSGWSRRHAWASSSGGASSTASPNNWNPSFGATLTLRPVGSQGTRGMVCTKPLAEKDRVLVLGQSWMLGGIRNRSSRELVASLSMLVRWLASASTARDKLSQ